MEPEDRIIIDPEILAGKPILRGTRISVELLLELLANGWTYEEISENYPQIRRIDMTTASGTEKTPLITVDCISVLEKEARDVPCIVHDLPKTSRVDGLLGLRFLRRFKFCLDFQKGVLEIE